MKYFRTGQGDDHETMYGCRKPAQKIEKIIGQVQAIDRMVEEDIACEDMLSQINAAKSALHRVGQIVWRDTSIIAF